MNWLNRLTGGGGGKSGSDRNAYWLYAQCGRCGSPVAVRVNLANDLSHDYESGGLVLVKEIMDSKCFQLMRATLRFSNSYKVTGQELEGGKFITRGEYEALTAGTRPSP